MKVSAEHIHEHLCKIENKLNEAITMLQQDALDKQSLAESLKIFQANNKKLKAIRKSVENASH